MAIIHLGRRLPAASSNLPGSLAGPALRAQGSNASLFGLAPDGVYLARRVATKAAGGLLPHRFTLTPEGAVYFLLHLPGITSSGRYPASCPAEPGLSSA